MGNDGGSIPTRRELVKNAARNPNTSEVKAALLESQTHAWTYCPLSQRPLSAPIVSDSAGTLYNKDAVLEFLLPSADPVSAPPNTEQEDIVAERIKSLRDIVEVKFQTEKDESSKREKRICPVTSKELGANTRAVYLVPCGHAFSEVAIKEVPGDSCITCNEPFKAENVISILPVAQGDIARLSERIKSLREAGLAHSLKKAPGAKKRKKHAEANGADATSRPTATDESEKVEGLSEKTKKRLADAHGEPLALNDGATGPQSRSGTATPLGAIKNAATASLTARVLDEQEERNKRRKLGLNDNLKSLFSNPSSNGMKQNGGDFMTRGYSIPKKA
ncbi:MAG: hypothetical protein M1818_000407 [Claussenomyces sp. TS43310]|nr:MAG: hypothetical protein M1818_000407 [Claussenomyces sp. TS43310]